MIRQKSRWVTFSRRFIAIACLVLLQSDPAQPLGSTEVVQEQRIEIIIRDSSFQLTKLAPIRLGVPTILVIRNEDSVRHGFTSPMFFGLLVHAEGEGIVSYGKGVEGFYVSPGKSVAIRFTTEHPGSHSFRCDLHPQMKGELLMLNVTAV